MNFIFDYRPLKSEQWQTRLLTSGHKRSLLHNTGSSVANLSETKVVLNRFISDSDKVQVS